jgi:hypothetical protein
MVNFLGQKVMPPLRESDASLKEIAMVFQKGYRVIKASRSKNAVFKV